jgi:protein-S-isoprenylcysteine O-methyltransferase Ste14
MGRHNLVWVYWVVPLVAAAAAAVLAVVDPFVVSPGVLRVGGLVPAVTGPAFVGWTVSTVRGASETLSPVASPAQLLTSGPFAHTRNPMYLGVVVTTAGVSLLGASPVAAGYTTLLWVTYHLLVVLVEEPELREEFGPEYGAYREQVPRWVPSPW